jgi:molecular chaperone HtpG
MRGDEQMSVKEMEFRTEVKELLGLMIHSLYSHKEIFLRELLSNASDAVDKARYESLTRSEVLTDGGDWKIKIIPDRKAGTLTILDNGIGMTSEEAASELGTIAHSGTREFLATLKDKDLREHPELIGQFGVGFYSAFMVADKVTVVSKKAGADDKAVKWESEARGSFTVEQAEKDTRGTDVILHLKEDEKKFLEEWEIRGIVKEYSDYIEHPIVMDVTRTTADEKHPEKKTEVTEEEVLNSRKAIWLKKKAEVTEEEYREFYKYLSHNVAGPAGTVHYRAEGAAEFSALLYIPAKAPLGIFLRDFEIGPALYVKRVQIMHRCPDLIPPYLRFVQGVVESADLPLNISREMLQNNRQVELIKRNITKKVLDALRNMKDHEYEKYAGFYRELGRVLKEGIHLDFARREEVADLVLLESSETESEAFTTLKAYTDRMKPDQEEIYFITGTSRDEVADSPYIESFRSRGFEVLFMLDEIDDLIFSSLGEYKGKKLKSVIKGDVSLSEEDEKEKEEAAKKYEKLISLMQDVLKDKVKEVRLSGRLKDSPCCLVAEEGAPDPSLEKLMQAMGQPVPQGMKTLEINPSHPVFERMNALFEAGDESDTLREYTRLLYDQALMLMGSPPEDPAGFARAVSRLMAEGLKTRSD